MPPDMPKMRCPNCGVNVRGRAELFARPVPCPKCRAQGVFVPAEEKKRGDTQELPPAPGSRLLGRWIGSRQAWLIAGVAVAALVVLVGYFALAGKDLAALFWQGRDNIANATLPLAVTGKEPSTETLAPYGSLRAAGVAPRPLAKDAKGVLLYYGHETKFSEILTVAQTNPSLKGQGASAYPPVAVMVSPREPYVEKGLPEMTTQENKIPAGKKVRFRLLEWIFALPEITAQEKGAPAGADTHMDTLVIRVSRLGAWGCRFRVRAFETASESELAAKLAQLRSTVDFPVRIVPKDNVTLSAVVTTVDACLRAKITLDRITLDPTEALGGTVHEKIERDIFKKPDVSVDKSIERVKEE